MEAATAAAAAATVAAGAGKVRQRGNAVVVHHARNAHSMTDVIVGSSFHFTRLATVGGWRGRGEAGEG